MQHSRIPPPHAATSIVHQSGGSQMPTNLLSTPATNQPTMQHSRIPPPHADTSIVHQSGGSQMPTNSLSTPATNQPTTLFLESEPMHAGRRWKCRDMSSLSLCLCSDSTRPDDTGSIRCQRARCKTVWVSLATSNIFRILTDDATYSTTFNALGTRTLDQGHGHARPAH
jgi:hypothetical protein